MGVRTIPSPVATGLAETDAHLEQLEGQGSADDVHDRVMTNELVSMTTELVDQPP